MACWVVRADPRFMEEIIKKAIEGGYKWNFHDRGHEVFDTEGNSAKYVCLYAHILDPLFWQALGKACGWAERICFNCGGSMSNTLDDKEGLFVCTKCGKIEGRLGWHHHAMVFHSTNLTEGWDKAVEYLEEVTRHPK